MTNKNQSQFISCKCLISILPVNIIKPLVFSFFSGYRNKKLASNSLNKKLRRYPVLLMLLKLVSISCAILTLGFTFDIKPLISQMRIMCYCSTTRFWVNLRVINQNGNILHIAKTWFRKKDFSDILKISKKFQKKFQKSYFE